MYLGRWLKINIALNPLKNGKTSHFHRTEEYRIDRGIRNTSRQISFEFLFIKTRPLANYIPDSDAELNDETKSVM